MWELLQQGHSKFNRLFVNTPHLFFLFPGPEVSTLLTNRPSGVALNLRHMYPAAHLALFTRKSRSGLVYSCPNETCHGVNVLK